MTDLTYKIDNMFIRFFPETPAGEDAWREMAKQDGTCTFFAIHKNQILSQLRKAGYKVAKYKASNHMSLDEILKELEA